MFVHIILQWTSWKQRAYLPTQLMSPPPSRAKSSKGSTKKSKRASQESSTASETKPNTTGIKERKRKLGPVPKGGKLWYVNRNLFFRPQGRLRKEVAHIQWVSPNHEKLKEQTKQENSLPREKQRMRKENLIPFYPEDEEKKETPQAPEEESPTEDPGVHESKSTDPDPGTAPGAATATPSSSKTSAASTDSRNSSKGPSIKVEDSSCDDTSKDAAEHTAFDSSLKDEINDLKDSLEIKEAKIESLVGEVQQLAQLVTQAIHSRSYPQYDAIPNRRQKPKMQLKGLENIEPNSYVKTYTFTKVLQDFTKQMTGVMDILKYQHHESYVRGSNDMMNEVFRQLDEFLAEPRNLRNEDYGSEKSIQVNGEKIYVLGEVASYKFNNIVSSLTHELISSSTRKVQQYKYPVLKVKDPTNTEFIGAAYFDKDDFEMTLRNVAEKFMQYMDSKSAMWTHKFQEITEVQDKIRGEAYIYAMNISI